MLKRRKFLVGGFIILSAIGYLGYTAFAGAATYYYTVSELVTQGSSVYDETVRVNGQVASGSIERDDVARTLRFTINDTDCTENVPVFYTGVVPDTFKDDGEVVVEGYLNSEGVFQASILMPKCPTRYVPEN